MVFHVYLFRTSNKESNFNLESFYSNTFLWVICLLKSSTKIIVISHNFIRNYFSNFDDSYYYDTLKSDK